MTRSRLLASILAVALAGMSIGTATAWLSDSATITYEISAASDFGGEPIEKVWVCKLVGPPDDPQLHEGANPIHVSVDSSDAEEGFSDAHPSYVVESGDIECEVTESGEPETEEHSPDETDPESPDVGESETGETRPQEDGVTDSATDE